MGSLRTCLDAPLAANAFGLIDHPDIAMRRIDMTGSSRTVLNAQWRHTLATYGHHNVIGIFRKGWSIPDDLYPRQ
jgi:hypothetical protein